MHARAIPAAAPRRPSTASSTSCGWRGRCAIGATMTSCSTEPGGDGGRRQSPGSRRSAARRAARRRRADRAALRRGRARWPSASSAPDSLVARRPARCRRVYTACVRRSSSGASSRKAYGRGVEDLVRERATARACRAPRSAARRDGCGRAPRCRPSKSIASSRQSRIVCVDQRMIGNLRDRPGMFSRQAAASGNTAAIRSSASMRCSCGAHLAAAAAARHRERDRRVPAPARLEHRRVEERLHQRRRASVSGCR